MKLLLIDDEIEFVSALAERLAFRGIDAHWTENGTTALRMVKECDYDLAVLDVKMPQLGGFDLKRMMSEIRSDMKFIFLSGHGSAADFEMGSAHGGHYLIKPIDLDELIVLMRTCVHSK